MITILALVVFLEPDPVGTYLTELERTGRIAREAGSLEKIRAALVAAEDSLVGQDPRTATTILYGIVESPRFKDWSETTEFENALLLLGRSLARGGASLAAERYLMQVLERGPRSPYFAAAYRALVDLALDRHETGSVLKRLEALKVPEMLPKDSESELAYLRGKYAFETRDLETAERSLKQVERSSRLFAPSLYLRGLIRVRQRDGRGARDAFCEIAWQPDKQRFAFYVDSRYFALKDLAHMALARMAHESGRYDEAYYFYFQVPEESRQLSEALFEASWSMFQRGEFDSARTMLEDLTTRFPKSPLSVEALLLRANVELKSCGFDKAAQLLDQFVAEYGPVEAEVKRALADKQRRRALLQRLLARDASQTEGDRLLVLLKLDPRFFELATEVAELDQERSDAGHTAIAWQDLARRQAEGNPPAADAAALEIVRELDALVPLAAGNRDAEARIEHLRGQLVIASQPSLKNLPFSLEAKKAVELGAKAAELRGRLVTTADELFERALGELDQRLTRLLRQVRLAQIDAVLGKKKKLELELSSLAKGRFPPELYGKLQAEGLIGDDEEYWPFEGEHWADEYENFK